MTASFLDILFNTPSSLLAWLLTASLKGSLIILIIMMIRALFRKRVTAQTLFLIWLAVFVPLMMPVGIPVKTDIFWSTPESGEVFPFSVSQQRESPPHAGASAEREGSSIAERSDPVNLTGSHEQVLNSSVIRSTPAWLSLERAMGLVWVLGVLFILSLIGTRVMRQKHLMHSLEKASNETAALMEKLRDESGMHHQVRVMQSDQLETPIVFGMFKPVIVLPAELVNSLSDAETGHIFLHELAHIRRRDIWVNWLAVVVQVVHWFNPLVWLAMKRMREDMERACDETALRYASELDRRDYGRTLLHLSALPSNTNLAYSLGIAESRHQLSERIRRIVSFRKQTCGQYILAGSLVMVLSVVSTLQAADTEGRVINLQSELLDPAPLSDDQAWTLVSAYCSQCHNEEATSGGTPGGLNLEALLNTPLQDNREVWEKSQRWLLAGHPYSNAMEFPYASSRNRVIAPPPAEQLEGLRHWIVEKLDEGAAFRTPVEMLEDRKTQMENHGLASGVVRLIWNNAWFEEPFRELAESGDIRKPEVLNELIRDMLADSKSSRFVTRFTHEWLRLDNLDMLISLSDLGDSPGGAYTQRALLKDEITLFVNSVLLSDQSILRLLDADYTYLNEDLADFYNISGVSGSEFRRVELDEPERFGLLGKGAWLMASGYSERVSFALRGIMIMDMVLGTEAPWMPPNIEAMSMDYLDQHGTSQRQLWQDFISGPGCRGCHVVMDGMGFALGNFDPLGRYMNVDPNTQEPFDTRGILPNGQVIDGAVELRQGLLAYYEEEFVINFVQHLLEYDFNRELTAEDMPAVRHIVRQSAADDYRFESIVINVVNSDLWRSQQ